MQVVLLTGDAHCTDYTKASCWNMSPGITFDPAWMPNAAALPVPHPDAADASLQNSSEHGNSLAQPARTRGSSDSTARSSTRTARGTGTGEASKPRAWEEPGAIYNRVDGSVQ